MNTNPMLQKYHALIASGKTITEMRWQKDNGPRKPTGLRYIFGNGTEELLDISDLSEDDYRKYYDQLKTQTSDVFD
jgi:hypothetical protein